MILISVPHWLHRPCNAPTWFYTVGEKLSVKAGLAIYDRVLDVSRRCMSVLVLLFITFDFSSCANWDSFCKSSHLKTSKKDQMIDKNLLSQ